MKLLEPIKAGRLQLKNRLVFPPYEVNWATGEGHVTPALVHLWKLLARGGCGLIILQATNANPNMEYKHTRFITSLHDDSYIPEYRRAVAEVKTVAPDVSMAVQLVDKSVLGRHITVNDLSIGEIKDIVEYLAQAARRAKEAGFDAVEYHAAHCYTLADFLSKRGNNRPSGDPYGRSREGRLRIHREVIARTRELAGDIPIIYRYSADEFVVGGNTMRDGIETAQALQETGVDIISISAGGRLEEGREGYSATRAVPYAYYEEACHVYMSERIKQYVSIPVIIAGRIGTIALANQVVEEGKTDLVAMGRQLFCDPLTLKKTLEGREADILRCSWCRRCHITYLAGGRSVCDNPHTRDAWRSAYMPGELKEQSLGS